MNCLELRRMAILEPRQLDEVAFKHAEHCDACRDFLARTLQFESDLVGALRVQVPAGAKERAVGAAIAPAAARAPRWMAIAAGFVLAVALGLAISWPRNDPMALAGIDFVVYEEAQAILDAKPVDPEALQRVVAQLGIALPEQLGELRYVGPCPFAGTIAQHVVARTAMGKVTLLLLPDRPLATRAVASARGLEAVITPAGRGSVAIVAGSPHNVERTEMLLKSS
jgi:hypothetical protein